MDRISRRLTNLKQNKTSVSKIQPSLQTLREGDEILYQPKNKSLRRYRREGNILWYTSMIRDGNLSIDKNLSVDGSINLKNKIIINNYPAFRVTADANQALAAGAWTTITFASSMHDNGSNFDLSNEYFVAPVNGIYSFTAQVLYEDSFSEHMDDGERLDLRIYNITDSATVAVGLYMMKHDFPDDRFLSVHCTTQTQLSVGDQIRTDSNNTTGSIINTYVSTQTTHSYFTGHLICAL